MLSRVAILPEDIRREVDAELQQGERLIWADQPVPGLYAREAIGLFIFGLVWTAFSVVWMVCAAVSVYKPGHVLFSLKLLLFGLPFALFGIALLGAPRWMRRMARRSVYVVTDRRAIVILGRAFGRIETQSFPPERLRSIDRTERPDGSGDLIFEHYWRMVGRRSGTMIRRGFIAVANVQDVENLIYKTL